MENLSRLVSDSLAQNGVSTTINHQRLEWSRWLRRESSFSVLLAPSKPGIFALGEERVEQSLLFRRQVQTGDLVRIVQGGYYGHPNPSRKQYVLMGGNPTAGIDPWEIVEYPVGVEPDPHFNPANLIFNLKSVNGTSADGCTEYTLPGPLKGRLLVCFPHGGGEHAGESDCRHDQRCENARHQSSNTDRWTG